MSVDSYADPDSCRYCKFWVTREPDQRERGGNWNGKCAIRATAQFPNRYADDWCGDFADKGLRAKLKELNDRKYMINLRNYGYRQRDRALKAEKALKVARARIKVLEATLKGETA